MGRYLENWILDQIQKIGKKNNINKIIFEHIENSKNKNLISDFIKKNNLSFLGKKNRCQFLKDFSFSEFNKKSKFYELDTKKKVKNISIY
jgi:flavorubredoxin